MKIAYLTSRYPAISHTFVQREIAALRQVGVDVRTFSIRPPLPDHPMSASDRIEQRSTVYILPPSPLRLLAAHLRAACARPHKYLGALVLAITKRPPGLKALVWQLFYFAEAVLLADEMRRAGLSHVHVHFAMSCASVAMIAARLGTMTYGLTVHGPSVFYAAERYQLREKVEGASIVYCISDFCRSQVMAHSDPRDWDKLHVVHCGVDTNIYQPVESHASSAKGFNLLTVGRIAPVKAHEVLLRAMAELVRRGRQVTCTIVGDGPERARAEQLAKALEIDTAVNFAGYVDQDRIQQFYDRANAFVLPSFAEGVPVVLMEAMAKALPVVATRIAGIPELIDDGRTGLLVTPARLGELADAIETLIDDPELCLRLGRAARIEIENHFNVTAIGRQIRSLLEQSGLLVESECTHPASAAALES